MSNSIILSTKLFSRAWLCGCFVILAACAGLPSAQMRLPSDLAVGDAFPVSGIGAGNRGSFSIGTFVGRFERDETRLALADSLFEQREFEVHFGLTDRQTRGWSDVTCRMHASVVTVDVVSLETEPAAYLCNIQSEDRRVSGRLELRAVRRGPGGMLSLEERHGDIELDGISLQIHSVHEMEGTSLKAATAVGYVLSENGEPVGAVSLNGTPVVTLRSGADERLRRAVVIAALALGLFRDPAASMLGREVD